jgi:hypothetical protein
MEPLQGEAVANGPQSLQDLISLRKRFKIECRVKTNLAAFKLAA